MSGNGRRSTAAPVRVVTRDQLQRVARELGVRPDWHEPDEQGVTAVVTGKCLDNAGFDGSAAGCLSGTAGEELGVTIFKDGQPVAEVNLAMLLSWACGYTVPDAAAGGLPEGFHVPDGQGLTAGHDLEVAGHKVLRLLLGHGRRVDVEPEPALGGVRIRAVDGGPLDIRPEVSNSVMAYPRHPGKT
jgi:hypothetical protein